MNEEEIAQKIENLEERVSVLEDKFSKFNKKEIKLKDKKTLSNHIIVLRDEKFFLKPQTSKEVRNKLGDCYHCKLNRVEVALKKLADRKELRITSKIISGKNYKAYVW